jgi:hypothetical protein
LHPGVRLARLPSWALLVALVGLAVALRLAGAFRFETPWIMPDEALYALLGRSLWSGDGLTVHGEAVGFYSLLHPLLIGWPLAHWDGVTGYRVAQAVGAVAMSAAAVPVYLWGRGLMRERWALVAAALTLALPALVLSGLLMTETVFLPVTTLAAWALAAALVRPTLVRQALLVAAIGAACATRLQAIVLVPTLVTAAVGWALLVRSPRSALRLWPTAAALLVVGAAWTAWRLHDGGSLSEVLGGYQAVGESSYPVVETVKEIAWHLGGVAWLVGVAPVIALVVLLVVARRTAPAPGEAALLAVAASLAVWLAVEVGIFATRYVEHLAERDLLTAAPPLFLVLCLWLDRGAPRPRHVTAVAAVTVAGLVAFVPFERWTTDAALPDAPSFAGLLRTTPALGWIAAAGIAALVVLLPRRLLAVVPALLVVLFAAGSVIATDEAADASGRLRDQLLGPERTWVDGAADGPTVHVYGGDAHWNAVWEHAFWNRRITSAATIYDTMIPGAMPQAKLTIRPDGTTTPSREARYAIVPIGIELAGNAVAEAPQQETAQRALVLWRLDEPLRFRSRVTGIQANGDVYSGGRLTVWDCHEGRRFLVTLLGKVDAPIEILQDEQVRRTVRIPPGESQFLGIPARPRREGGVCVFDVRSPGIFGTTQFRYER